MGDYGCKIITKNQLDNVLDEIICCSNGIKFVL